MAQKRDPLLRLEQRKSAREFESWALGQGATWSQAYKMADADIRKGMLARRSDEKARQKALAAEKKASIATKFSAQRTGS